MKIQQTSPVFGRGVLIHTKDDKKADKLENLLPEDNYYVNREVVGTKKNKNNEREEVKSLNIFVLPKEERNYYEMLSKDIAASLYPERITDDEGNKKVSGLKLYAQQKVEADVLDKFMKEERKNAINVTV